MVLSQTEAKCVSSQKIEPVAYQEIIAANIGRTIIGAICIVVAGQTDRYAIRK